MSINQIVRGTMNNILNKEEELFNERIQICRECPLLYKDKIFGEICNPTMYLNPITGKTSKKEKPGFKRGCGCILASKCRVKEAHCPLSKW